MQRAVSIANKVHFALYAYAAFANLAVLLGRPVRF